LPRHPLSAGVHAVAIPVVPDPARSPSREQASALRESPPSYGSRVRLRPGRHASRTPACRVSRTPGRPAAATTRLAWTDARARGNRPPGNIDCAAGYELAIAQQAVARNKALRVYGLQWTAPGWTGAGANTVFTAENIGYLLDWLGCAKQYGVPVSYLGGWNESEDNFRLRTRQGR
jgi:Glycosyl hydrolase family 59